MCCRKGLVLEKVGAHLPIATIAVQTSYALLGSFLAWVEVLAVLFAVEGRVSAVVAQKVWRNSALLELVGGRAGPRRCSLVWSLLAHRDLCRSARGAVTCRVYARWLGRSCSWGSGETLLAAASAAEAQNPCILVSC
jgi:hypothetical protein